MKVVSAIFKTDKFFLGPLIVSIFSIIAITGYLFYFYESIPDRLPLLYSLTWGQDQLVTKQQFFILPSVVGLISFVNAFLALQLKNDQLVLKRILTLSLLLINLISLIAAFNIYWIFT